MVTYALQKEGLQTGLEELIDNLLLHSSPEIKTDWNLGQDALDLHTELHIYRIVQELLTNAIRHAKASLIQLSVHRSEDKLVVSLSDNGQRFDQAEVRRSSRGLGLRNVLVRVKVLKGRLYVTTAKGKGTTYQIVLPVH